MRTARSGLWRQVLETSGANGAYVAGSGIVLFITARTLGPEGRGAYAVLTGWVLLFATLGSLSLGQVALHRATERPGGDALARALGSCLAICGIVVAIDWTIVAVGYALTGGSVFRHLLPTQLALAFVALPFLIINANLPYVLYSVGQLRRANVAQVVGAVASVAAATLLVAILRLGVSGALAAFIVGAGTASGLFVWYVTREVPRPLFDFGVVREMVGKGLQLHLNAVGTYLFTQTSVLILNHFRPLAESGYYQLATQLFALSLMVSTSMGTVAYTLVSKNGADAAWPQQRRLIGQAMILMAVGAAAGFVLAPWAVALVAGAAFQPAVQLFRWMLPATIGGTFSALMASQWIGRGLFWQAAVVTFAIGLASVACDLILIPRRGMHGAVVSTLITYGLAFAVNVAMALWVDRKVSRLGVLHADGIANG